MIALRRSRVLALLAAFSLTPCGAAEPDAPFLDATADSGLDFWHFNGMTGDLLMPEIMGSGVAMIDYDRDGDLDLFMVQGAVLGPGRTLDDALIPPRHPDLRHRLYRNDSGDGRVRFTDVTDDAIPLIDMYGMGAAIADVDGDGWEDILVTGLHGPALLINRGDGSFTEATADWGLTGGGWSVSATFFDHDADGDPDLFIGDYVKYRYPPPRNCISPGELVDYCPPQAFVAAPDHLYRNDGDRFVDITEAAGLGEAFGPALGAIASDLDADGDLDLYVANDAAANQLWINQGDGTFIDDSLFAGVALNGDGMPEGSMGVDAADFDGDGDEDIFITHFRSETNTLYVNDGSGLFDDRSNVSGLGRASFPYTGFGTTWFDYDNDGWLDLLVANGATFRKSDSGDLSDLSPMAEPNQLFRNTGDGRFEDRTRAAGEPFRVERVSRGAAFGDLDGDGDTDVVLTNNGGPAQLLINQVGTRNHWVGLRLRDTKGRPVVGARVRIGVADRELWRRSRRDGSYASANDPDLLIGLADHAGPIDATVHWPDGRITEHRQLMHDRYHVITQGDAG